MNYKVIDTNIILLDAYNVVTLGQDGSTIVIPEIAVDELDSKKSLMNELGFQARDFGRMLSSAKKLYIQKINNMSLSLFEYDGTTIAVTSSSSYGNFTDADPGIINDRMIIDIASQLAAADHNVTFVSNDVMCRIRAESLGLTATDIRTTESADYEFVKDLELDIETFSNIKDKPVAEIDPGHKPENYSYRITCPDSSQVKLATVSNGMLKVIGPITEKELRRQDINPVNAEQLFLSKALQDTTIDIVVCDSKAGSGKTLVSLSNGIRMVKKGHYDSIVYIRASVDDVDDAEAVGFLPGLEEKFAVYLHPLQDSLDCIVRNAMKASKEKGKELDDKVAEGITKLKSSCNIEGITGLGLRGRTFTNAYVIIDEFQNQSKSSAQKMLTRFGKDCKIIIIGSNRQIDNKYLTKYTNGMSVILNAAKDVHENIKMFAVALNKVVRGPIAEFAENLFEKST